MRNKTTQDFAGLKKGDTVEADQIWANTRLEYFAAPKEQEHATTRFYLGGKKQHFRMGEQTIKELFGVNK